MTAREKPVCQALTVWLTANLGKGWAAALTGTDARALPAAVHIVELISIAGTTASLAKAFGFVVETMQPSTRYLAYHAIAHVLDWSDRDRIWDAADLAPVSDAARAFAGRRDYEPAEA